MRLILDASGAIELVMNRGKAKLFTRAVEEAEEVLAPDLLVAEVVNTVWKYHRFENLSATACDQTIELTLGLVDSLVSCAELHREAFLLARVARRPAYDMFYLALARREDGILLTADASLRKEAKRQGIRVV